MTHLSLCSGIGGLEMALGTPDVFAEIDPAPSEVLAHHYPTVPNIGDWTTLETFTGFDLVSGGLPCQPVSGAGKGRGDADERYLFDDLIRILRSGDVRPTLVLENVRGILYPRHGRIFWRLISALADLGYVGGWETVRASDAGAPHRRERWFCVATHPDRQGLEGRGVARLERGRQRPTRSGGVGVPTDPASGGPPNDTDGERTPGAGPYSARGREPQEASLQILRSSRFGPAVARWERLTRPCPSPLDDGKLSVAFTEWMMGFPDGYVGDLLPRSKALKALGNAVVPQQARLALSILEVPSLSATPSGFPHNRRTYPT